MSEFMGLIFGKYDAKEEGFVPGGASLHNCMSGHGPDAVTVENAINSDLTPQRYDNTLAFMFETRFVICPTKFAMETPALQQDYFECWRGLKKHFAPPV
jgi:homogentisate 1,2-dioxygenase